jgi:O-antigen/teichoic acid export membrane protein
MQLLPRMLRAPLMARAAESSGPGQRAQLSTDVGYATTWLFVLSAPVAVGLVVVGPWLFRLLGGLPLAEPLVFVALVASALVDVVATPAANTLPGAGDARSPGLAALAALVLALVLWGVGGPTYGSVALAVGMLVNSVCKGAPPVWVVVRRYGWAWPFAVWRLWWVCGASVAAAGAAMLLELVAAPWVLLSYAVVVGVCMWHPVRAAAAQWRRAR